MVFSLIGDFNLAASYLIFQASPNSNRSNSASIRVFSFLNPELSNIFPRDGVPESVLLDLNHFHQVFSNPSFTFPKPG